MNEYERKIAIFGYETQGGRSSLLWGSPLLFDRPGGQGGKQLDEDFGGWQKRKRPFSAAEVVSGSWIKVGDHGWSFVVRFHPDGTVTESNLFDTTQSWTGSWRLVGWVLRVNIKEFELDIFANREGRVHSGIEIRAGSSPPNAYFKVIHLDQSTM